MLIKFGTNRVVLVTRRYAYKIPRGRRGLLANEAEFKNAANNPCVAKTEKHLWWLRQERLRNLRCFSLGTTIEAVPAELRGLFEMKLHNRLQAGQDENGVWKFYDYEDIKYYQSK